jgi:hypothetical protein
MFVPLFINVGTWMLQVPVNSGRARITFLFLDEATNVRENHGLASFR